MGSLAPAAAAWHLDLQIRFDPPSAPAPAVRTAFATLLALTLCTSAARGQGASVRPMPATGELVRVTPASGEPFTGRVAALGGDTLMLAGTPGIFVVASRERLEILRRHRESWSAFGALAGLLAGVGVRIATSHSRSSPHALADGVVSGAAGALVGGVIGFSVAPQRWQPLHSTIRALPPPAAPLNAEAQNR